MTSPNHAGLAHAHALIAAGAVDRASAWSFDASDGNALLGASGDNWTRYGQCHLGLDSASPDQTRGHFKYPCAKFKGATITLYRSALTAIRQRAGQRGDTEIFAAAGKLLDAIDGRKDRATAAAAAPLALVAAASFDFAAAGTSGEGDTKGGPPKFKMIANTGAPMRMAGWKYPVVLDFSGAHFPSQNVPVRFNHDAEQGVGHTTSVGFEGGNLAAAGVVSRDTPAAREIVAAARNGFPWQASVGGSSTQTEFVPEGKSAVVNGLAHPGPVNIARQWSLGEISFVDLGADPRTSASVAASSPSASPSKEPTVFEKWLEAKGFDPASLTETQTTNLRALYDAEQSPAKPGNPTTPNPTGDVQATAAQTLEAIFADARDEQRRQAEVARITAQAIQNRPMMIDQFEAAAKAAIADRKITVLDFELSMMRLERTAPVGAFAVHCGKPAIGPRLIEAAACMAGALPEADLKKSYDERTLNAAADKFPQGLGLKDLLHIAAREHGHSPRPGDLEGLLRGAFDGGPGMIRADGASSLSLPTILSNIANKFLVLGFNAVEDKWRLICNVASVRDFKTKTNLALTGGFDFEKVGAAGELKHATAGELVYTNQADTYGKIFAITRRDLVNDDLGALTEVPRKIGRGAALALNKGFWTAFLAGVGSYWTSGRNNLLTGAGTALSSSALASAYATFLKQTDPDGFPIAVEPRILLTPPELETTALALIHSMLVVGMGGGTNTLSPNGNIWANKFTPVSSTYLSNASFTGNSATAWYLLADPMDLPTIEVAFLNGRQTPIVESAQAEFDTLGIQMRGYFDWGCSLQEFRGSQRNAGA